MRQPFDLGRLESQSGESQQILLDIDIGSDADDAGAVAMLHPLADQGRARVVGMIWRMFCY